MKQSLRKARAGTFQPCSGQRFWVQASETTRGTQQPPSECSIFSKRFFETETGCFLLTAKAVWPWLPGLAPRQATLEAGPLADRLQEISA